jgi:conjugative relaxase-like TrwC/TraI family protein
VRPGLPGRAVPVLSLHTGYDTAYLTDAVGTGADYYTGAPGEPPGYWQGAGARALGLAGQVDPDVMRRLYHEDVGPDGQVLVRRQRKAKYPEAGGSLYERIEAEVAAQVARLGRFCMPEEERAIRLRERAKFRTVVPFYDYTFSPPKTVTVLWASFLQAAAEAEAAGDEAEAERLTKRAGQVRGAVKRANDRMMAVAEREAAYVRTGHHSATSGEYRDAEGFITASFEQHDARDGAPQLHVHNAIANRAQRADGADGKWRALHGQPLFRERLRFGTLGDRFLAQELELLGLRTVLREDGRALEVGGISDEAADVFSSRSKELRARARELAHAYERDHGYAPGKAAWYKIRQQAALETRASKDHDPPQAGQQLAAWARRAERSGAGPLGSLHEASDTYAAEHAPSEPLSEAKRRSVIRQAVARVQAENATWTRAALIFHLGQVLPALPGDVDPEAYLDELAAEAVSGRAEGVNVLQIAPVPDLIDISRLESRKDGTSIYRPPGEERFCTAEHADREKYLVDVAVLPVRPRMTPEAAAAALAGADLDFHQREACEGLLASKRLINCLVAPAGTGKTHVVAAFARIWAAETGGRVIGLTASTNAARVMADEAERAGAPMVTRNIAQFLGKIKDSDRTRGHMEVLPGDVLVVDEATQVSTEDALRITQIARRCGAMVVATFDPAQLGAVDAGGIFPLIAARHGSWRLNEVRRFRHAWERDASLRLRRGEVEALAEYAARGRIWHGPQDRVYDDAVKVWLNGHLSGQESLLMATSNQTAAKLAALARERLAEYGIVGPAEITLADGNGAGRGDLVRARLNTRIDADGQTLANRDTIRIEGLAGAGEKRMAVVTRQTGPGEWSRPFFVPAAYLEQSAELAYAGNVHVAQGRTVDTGHLVVDAGANRSLVYTGATRGREKNTIHVSTGPPDPAQPARAEREAYTDAAIRQRAELRRQGDAEAARAVPLSMPDQPSDRQLAPWEAILAQALQQDEPERTALEEIQAAQDWVTNTGHLLELSEAYWQLDVVPKIDEMVRQRIPAAAYERYLKDPERPAFLQELRAHEIGGRRIEDVLDSITAEPLDGLRSIAAGLHGRAGKEPPPARGETRTWADRAPLDAPEPVREAGRMLDTRAAELGRQVAAQPPPWALEAWGVPPQEPGALRDDWERRAGTVESYREAAGITDPAQALGPVPSRQAQLREAFHASVAALELPDDQALLRAQGRGELEAQVAAHDRAAALAPPDVQAEIGERERDFTEAHDRAVNAGYDMNAEAQAQAEADAAGAARDLTRLAVADAARQEWAEAHAAQAEQAREAEAELRRRDQAERVGQAGETEPEPQAETDEEFRIRLDQMVAEAEGREYVPPEPEPEPEPLPEPLPEAEFEEQLARMVAESEGREYVPPEPEPEPETGPEPGRAMPDAEFGQHLDRLVAEAEGREWIPPQPEAEPEPQPLSAPLPEPEFQEQLGRMVAEAEGREWVPPEPGAEPEPEPLPELLPEAEFQEQLGRMVAESEGREYVPPEPDPEPEPQPEPLSEAEFRAKLDQIVADSQRSPKPEPEPEAGTDPEAAEQAAMYAEIHEDLQQIGRGIDELSARWAAEDARRAEAQQELLNEPAPWQQAQAEAEAEASWQAGDAVTEAGQAAADIDMEAEI